MSLWMFNYHNSDGLPLNENRQPLEFANDQPQPGPYDDNENDIFSRMEMDFDNAGNNYDAPISRNSSLCSNMRYGPHLSQ